VLVGQRRESGSEVAAVGVDRRENVASKRHGSGKDRGDKPVSLRERRGAETAAALGPDPRGSPSRGPDRSESTGIRSPRIGPRVYYRAYFLQVMSVNRSDGRTRLDRSTGICHGSVRRAERRDDGGDRR
jgi:hypothetical protein